VESDAGRWVSAQRRQRTAALAIVLLALAIVFAVLYWIENHSEHHSYNAGARAPQTVHVTKNKQYEISVPGGVKRLAAEGIPGGNVTCTYTTSTVTGSVGQALSVTALGSDTRTVHAVATFVAPVTGQIHIACAHVASVFVDDADDVSADPAGLFIVLTTIALTLAAALGLSALYGRPPRVPARRARRQQQEAHFGHLLAPGTDTDDEGPQSG
jgi:hypothetical protein